MKWTETNQDSQTQPDRTASNCTNYIPPIYISTKILLAPVHEAQYRVLHVLDLLTLIILNSTIHNDEL